MLEVDGRLLDSLSGAAKAVTKARAMNGWWFWRLHDINGPRLLELRRSLESIDDVVELGPFTAEEIEEWWVRKNPALDELALAISDALPKNGEFFPSQVGKGDFRIARYWAHGPSCPNICIGIPKVPITNNIHTPLWARYHTKTKDFAIAKEHLLRLRDDAIILPESGCLWIPLNLDSNLKNLELVEDLVQQVRVIDEQARGIAE
jgi:hypothetical protein